MGESEICLVNFLYGKLILLYIEVNTVSSVLNVILMDRYNRTDGFRAVLRTVVCISVAVNTVGMVTERRDSKTSL